MTEIEAYIQGKLLASGIGARLDRNDHAIS
jgi:hypothetical protein